MTYVDGDDHDRGCELVLRFPIPEERCAARIAVRAMDWALAVSDLDSWLRNELKHGPSIGLDAGTLQTVRDRLHENLDGDGLSLADIE